MFFILSKILFWFLMPFTWIFLGLVLSLFLIRWRRKILIATLIWTYFFSNIIIVNELLKKWEYPSRLISSYKKRNKAIILGGACSANLYDPDRVNFNGSVNRIMHTIQLFKKHKINGIIYSGGSGYLLGSEFNESEKVKPYLVAIGIPDTSIWTEAFSRNTYENALYTHYLLQKNHALEDTFVLSTSAFHMRRSLACFVKQGIHVVPFSTEVVTIVEYQPEHYLPNVEAFQKWYLLIHEVAGYCAYKIMGYC